MEASSSRIRNGYRQPAEATGRMVGEIVYLLALAVTAGADVAAFDQVLSNILQSLGPVKVAAAVAGFTAMSLILAHFAGRLLRDHKAEHGPDGKRSVWLLVVPWALIGLAALLARLILAQSQAGLASTAVGQADPGATSLAGAVLFLILYLASGAVAGFGEYLTRNPYRAHYRTALRTYRRSLRRLDRSSAPYERAVSVWAQHEQGREVEDSNYHSAEQLQRAYADELKRYAAYLIAAHLQHPSATDGMTLPDRDPQEFPSATTSVTQS